MKKKVLFLCTGNSCRSQMAEAIVNARFGEKWDAISAGTRPKGNVNPLAIEVLREIGINHNGKSKPVDFFYETSFDLVVTVCDFAAEECPAWLGEERKVHHSFPDPAQSGDINDFRSIRDDMLVEIPIILAKFE